MMDNTFWALIGLLLFLGVLYYVKTHTWLVNGLDRRADDIRKELEEAKRLRVEAEELVTEYRQKRKEAEAEAADIIAAAERDAATFLQEAKLKTEEYIARRQTMAEQKIRQAETDAAHEVRASAVDLAVAAAGRLLAEKADSKTLGTLFRNSVDELKTRMH